MSFSVHFKNTILLKEGGNVFQGTRRITKDEIFATLKQLDKAFNYPLSQNLLGSTGKNPDSGDVDVAIDSSSMSRDSVKATAIQFADNDTSSVKVIGNAVHLKCPIWDKSGTKTSDFAQVDLNVSSFPEYLKWFYASNEVSPLKGRDRNILLSAVAKQKGFAISNLGLRNRITKDTISRDPKQIAKLILGKTATEKDIYTVPNIISKLKEVYGEQKAREIASAAEKTTGNSYF